jgi:L-fuconolactonase
MIDAHFHAWQLSRGDYGWLTPELGVIYRDVQVSDWEQHAKAHGIEGGVLVQAAPTFEETLFLLNQAHQHAMVKGVVGWIDMLAPDAIGKVAICAANPLLKGLRPMLQDIHDVDWILQTAIQPVLSAMAQHQLVLDALIKPVHLSNILKIAQAHPELKIVVDHGAKPKIELNDMAHWRTSMENLAQITSPNRVMCKMSGLWTEAPASSSVEMIQPWCKSLIDIWSPARIIWGSDWPVLELAGTYTEWRKFTLKVLENYSAADQALMLGQNARKIYQLNNSFTNS